MHWKRAGTCVLRTSTNCTALRGWADRGQKGKGPPSFPILCSLSHLSRPKLGNEAHPPAKTTSPSGPNLPRCKHGQSLPRSERPATPIGQHHGHPAERLEAARPGPTHTPTRARRVPKPVHTQVTGTRSRASCVASTDASADSPPPPPLSPVVTFAYPFRICPWWWARWCEAAQRTCG